MKRLILVCGSTGAGKTTYSIALAAELRAVRFSIDPWMQTLFGADMTSLDFDWITARVARCHEQIWQTGQQILALDGNVILDLGFTTYAQRQDFRTKAQSLKIVPELHYLDIPVETRRLRVKQRNESRDPELFAFEVTSMMFNFMEPRFEAPTDEELKSGRVISS